MTLLERIAKRAGFVKIKKDDEPAHKRSINPSVLQMAVVNRLTASWTTNSVSADSEARGSLATTRARSRQLRSENDYGAKFISMLKTNVLGDSGINFKSGVKEPDRVIANKLITGQADVFANKAITEAWWKWGTRKFCTVTEDMSWSDVQRVVLEAVATDGEHLIRKVITEKSDSPFGFRLQLIEATRLDENHNEMVSSNGNEIRMGVELDKMGRRVAYHILRQDPGESFFPRAGSYDRERVPASEIIHLGVIRRACQTRFMPWMSTAGYRLNMVGKYEEAEVTGARVAASKMGFITSTQGTEYAGDIDEDGNKIMDADPGSFENLLPGQDVKMVDWQHPSTAYQSFMKTALRGVAAGLGISYNSLANDMESVNFASGKLGLMEEREVWKALQAWFIESFCEEVFSSWLMMSLTSGAIPLPIAKFDKFNSPVFRGRRWAYVNPSQDVDADIRQINSGLTSISRILAERNIDRDELFDEIQADRQALEDRDISLSEILTEDPAMIETAMDTTLDESGISNQDKANGERA